MTLAQDTVHYFRLGTNSFEEAVDIEQLSDSTFAVLINSGDGIDQTNADMHVLEVSPMGKVLKSIAVGASTTERGNVMVIKDSLVFVGGTSNGMSSKYTGVVYGLDWQGNKLLEVYPEIEGLWSGVQQMFFQGDTLFTVLQALNDPTMKLEVHAIDAFTGQVYFKIELDSTAGFDVRAWRNHPFENAYIALGSFAGDSLDAFITNYSRSFERRWHRTHALSGDDAYESIDWFSDSNMIVAGWSSSYNGPDEDILIHLLDAEGYIIKEEVQGYNTTITNKNDRAYSIAIAAWDSIYLTGYTETYGLGQRDIFLSRIDSALISRQGSITFGTESDEWSVQLVRFGAGLVGIGGTNDASLGTQDALFWRRDSIVNNTSFLTDSTVLYEPDTRVLSVPEPSHDHPRYHWNQSIRALTINEPVDLVRLFDLQGRLIAETKSGSLAIHRSGSYILEIHSHLGRSYEKIFILCP